MWSRDGRRTESGLCMFRLLIIAIAYFYRGGAGRSAGEYSAIDRGDQKFAAAVLLRGLRHGN